MGICHDFCGLFVFLYPLGNGLYEEGHYWTQSLGNSILEIVILAFVSYLFFIYFRWQIEKSRRAKEPNRWKFVWRSYGMPFLLIILGVNATLAITRIFTGDAFHMDDI